MVLDFAQEHKQAEGPWHAAGADQERRSRDYESPRRAESKESSPRRAERKEAPAVRRGI